MVTGWVSYFIIRVIADDLKARLYVDPSGKVEISGPQDDSHNLHLHHFIYGLALGPPVGVMLWYHYWPGPILAGIQVALVGSEIKELILMKWGR